MPSKYGNLATSLGGESFDSRAEARRYQELQLLQYAGSISGLVRQVPFVLQEGFRDRYGHYWRAINYTCDFLYYASDGRCIVEDVKGHASRDFMLRAKLFARRYPEIEFRVVKS